MQKEQINSLVDGIASLIKIGLAQVLDETETVARGAGDWMKRSSRGTPRPPSSSEDPLLEGLLNTHRQQAGAGGAIYKIVSIKPAGDADPLAETQVRAEFPGGWFQVLALRDVLRDTPVAD